MTREKTTGSILKRLVAFSVPLILSGLFQQLFNWVDALIVGNFVGETALAGVGAVTSLYSLFVTTIVGFTSGLSVLFARQYGQGVRSGNAELLASYSVILTAVFAVISAFGMAFTAPILRLMDTPGETFLYAEDYLLIIFIGIPFLRCTMSIPQRCAAWETARPPLSPCSFPRSRMPFSTMCWSRFSTSASGVPRLRRRYRRSQ